MNSRYGEGRQSSYTARVGRPTPQRAMSGRAVMALALTLLAPPLGLFVMWRAGIFQSRGRMVLTGVATVEMLLLCVLLTPRQELSTTLPMPAAPARVTAVSESDSLSALYNIEELLYDKQLEDVLAAGGTARDLMTEEEKLEADNAENEIIYGTTVYSVFSDAIYYHASKVCRTQTNGRELTVRDALREGMQPCPYCNPPTPNT